MQKSKKLETLALIYEYIFLLMDFILGNQEHFQTNSTVHNVNIRMSFLDQLPHSRLKKNTYNSGINIFNSPQSSLKNFINKKRLYKEVLKSTHAHIPSTVCMNSCLKMTNNFSNGFLSFIS
jgi:hypothetical protein